MTGVGKSCPSSCDRTGSASWTVCQLCHVKDSCATLAAQCSPGTIHPAWCHGLEVSQFLTARRLLLSGRGWNPDQLERDPRTASYQSS